jgi:hypothetical protein
MGTAVIKIIHHFCFLCYLRRRPANQDFWVRGMTPRRNCDSVAARLHKQSPDGEPLSWCPILVYTPSIAFGTARR